MCNCKKTPTFQQDLSRAQRRTVETGEQHVVFHIKKAKLNFVAKESELTEDLGICCYFLPDGTEVAYPDTAENIAARQQSAVDQASANVDGGQMMDRSDDQAQESLNVPSDEYQLFVDKGTISKDRINALAVKVKAQEALDPRENAIFVANTADVEKAIKTLKK